MYLFLIIGAGAIAYFLYVLYENNGLLPNQGLITLLIVGSIFCLGALLMSKGILRKKYFDKTEGYFCIGNKTSREVYNPNENKNFTELLKIHALQIIKEKVNRDNNNFYSYELNLVCKNLSRVNITDHSRINTLREEAQMLSEFLDVPLWDGAK